MINFKKVINKASWKLYYFVDEVASDYRYGCKVAEGEKPSLYPKREDD